MFRHPLSLRFTFLLALCLAVGLWQSSLFWAVGAAAPPPPVPMMTTRVVTPTASALASAALATTTLSDFNGTGFDYQYGSWSRNISTGPTAVTIDRFATERGGAGTFLPGLTNLTGMGIALTAQLGAGNQASAVQVTLVDAADNRAVFEFPASRFNATAMTTVFLPSPTSTHGAVNLSQVRSFLVTGDFSSEDFFGMSIDNLAAVACTNNPVVTTNADSGAGSLREAITFACPGSTITFAPNVTTITLTSGELVISNKTLTIQGPGAKRLSLSGGNASRVLRTDNATVTLSHLTVTGGNGGGGGSNGSGGGIYQGGGALALVNIAVSGNAASSSGGGGIFNRGGSLTVTNATISNNTAYTGGGIENGGTLWLTNTTVSGNRATNSNGGGIEMGSTSTTTINHSTISNNTAGFNGGGVAMGGGALSLRNTIVAGNRATNAYPDLLKEGSFTTNGNNLIGSTDTRTPVPWLTSDITDRAPLLDPLGDYGGPTETMRPEAGSPAVNRGGNAGAPATDQRGYGRPYNGGTVDIGAVERGANDDFPVTETNGVITLTRNPASDDGRQELIAAIEVANDNPALTTIQLKCGTYSYAKAHNWEFGPNALPIIRSPITIEGQGAVLNATEPTRLRFFYVAGNGVGGLTPGTLTLQNLTLQNGKQKGGDINTGGGGAGMGGAIFNHGNVTLERVTLTGNTATGGNIVANPFLSGGGGMGQDAQNKNGGGFGGMPTGSGGAGGAGANSGGGGGGFLPMGSNGGNAAGTISGAGGGYGLLGGIGGNGAAAGDGGGGSRGSSRGSVGGTGGEFGGGGNSNDPNGGGGGGGVGGGGGIGYRGGGGGGFGGGGAQDNTEGSGSSFFGGFGGFGGGGGGGGENGFGGFGGFGGGNGGNYGDSRYGGGGGGLGGALFNHQGTLTLINCTLTANTATGGNGVNGGSGFGGALFNLNGSVTITSSTLAANTVTAGMKQGSGSNGGANGGAVYNLAYGNDFTSGGTTTAHVILRNSILANSTGGSDLVNDQRDSTTTPNGSQGAGDNTATVDYGERNLVMTSAALSNTSLTGTLYSSANPNLGALQTTNCKPAVLPLQSPSAAINAATPDPNVPSDQLGTARNISGPPDLGAFEVPNNQPTITARSPTLTAGAPQGNYTLASVDDAEDDETALTVTATPVSGSGVTLGPISVASNGSVTANVQASCTAMTSTFTLQVRDSGMLTASTTLTVTINANTPPTLSYPSNPSTTYGTALTISPTLGPSDNVTVTSLQLISAPVPGITMNSSGVISVAATVAAGNYPLQVRATDNCGGTNGTTTASFTLTVQRAPLTVTVNPVWRNVNEANPPLTGSLTGLVNNDLVTVSYSTSANILSAPGMYPITATLKDPGLKLSNYQVTNNPSTLTVQASCGFTVTPTVMAPAFLALPYAQGLTVLPVGTHTFSLHQGQLPPGLQLVNTAGVFTLQGTPTTPGTYSFTLRVQRSGVTCETLRTYVMTIAPSVVPRLNCVVHNANGTITAWFGYENATRAVVTIPVGLDNYFAPGAQNQGQVTTFQVGVVNNAFSVTYPNVASFTQWTVKGPDGIPRAVLPTGASPRCP